MLIEVVAHDVGMLGYILIAFAVVFLPLAYVAGADSRVDDVARRRRYNG